MNAAACIGRLFGTVAQGTQRREVGRLAVADQLVDALRADEITQTVLAEIFFQQGAGLQRFNNERGRDGREHHLAAMGAVHQPGTAVERGPEILLCRGPLPRRYGAPYETRRPSSPHSSCCRPNWLSRAAPTASSGLANAAQKPSPRDWTTIPACSEIAWRMMASCRASA